MKEPVVKIIEEAGVKKVWDHVRAKYVKLTPEESVRQGVLNYLWAEKGYPKGLISVEKEIELNGLKKRYDAVVYKNNKPIILIECKAPGVGINQKVFDQAMRYNIKLQVKYLIISNALESYFAEVNIEDKELIFFDEIESYEQL